MFNPECAFLDKKPVILLGGPTASGKSSLALDMADRVCGAIINADSVQLYADLAILSARPGAADCARVPHHLYGIFPSHIQTTAALWQGRALTEIERCHQKGQVPILVGGTGFYLKAIHDGLPFIPPVSPDVQDDVRHILSNHGLAYLYECLMAVDGDMARRLHPHDAQRIMRAYGVFISTNRSLSHWQAQPTKSPLENYAVFSYVVLPDKDLVKKQARHRLEHMFLGGAIDEVAALMARADRPVGTVGKALGVPEIMAYLRGDLTREQAFDQTLCATMQYIKRQRTWFRTQNPPNTHVLSSSTSSDWRSPLGRLC